MRVLDIALKDLRQIVRDRQTILFTIAMPIVFTVFFGLILRPGGDGGEARLPVGVIDGDAGGALAAVVVEMLEASGAVEPMAVPLDEEARAADDVADGRLAALLVLPPGFTEAALSGGDPQVRLVADVADPAGHGVRTVIETAVLRALSAARVAQLSAEAAEELRPFADAAARDAYLHDALQRGVAAWQDAPVQVAMRGTRVDAEPETRSASGFAQSSPGMIVQFSIYGLMTAAGALVLERRVGALQRLLTTPTSRAEIIAGKVLAMFLMVMVQQGILVGFGQVAFGVDYMHAPLATLLVMVAVALWAASLGLLIGAAARQQEQVVMYSLVAMFVLAAMGGAWFPLEVTGKTFSTIGHLLPTAWAMDGFQNIVLRGLGLSSVVTPVLVLVGYAVVLFGLAVWRLRFE